MRLQGGTKAENTVKSQQGSDASAYGSLFKPGVRFYDLTPKSAGEFRILPSFDYSLDPKDKLFKRSFVSYRDNTLEPDPDTESPGFTSWFFPVLAHRYFGNAKTKFLSPKNLNNSKRKGVDPLQDIFYFCYEKAVKQGDREYAAYYDKKVNTDAYIKLPQTLILMNAIHRDEEGNETVVVLTLTASGFIALKQALSEKRDPDLPPVSKDWPKYMFGDITHPVEGCWTYPIVIPFNSEHKPASLYPSKKKDSLSGYKSDKRDINDPDTIKLLEARYDISDAEKVCDVWDYQRLVDFLVDDGGIPINILKNACSDYSDIKTPTRKASTPEPVEELPSMDGEEDNIPMMRTPAPVKPSSFAASNENISSAVKAVASLHSQEVASVKVATSASVSEEDRAKFSKLHEKLLAGELNDPDVLVDYLRLKSLVGSN